MKQNSKLLLFTFICLLWFCMVMVAVLAVSGCSMPQHLEPSMLDSWIDLANAFAITNTASAPVNPYVFPIGIGLAGVTAMLEALRRKERSGRKHAEGKLNNGNNNK